MNEDIYDTLWEDQTVCTKLPVSSIQGGGVYQDHGETHWVGGSIRNCRASEDNGGGFYQNNGKAYFKNVDFDGNYSEDHGYSDGRIYLWSGVDNSIYNKKVVQTDASKEAAKSGTRLQNSINEAAQGAGYSRSDSHDNRHLHNGLRRRHDDRKRDPRTDPVGFRHQLH